MIRNPAPHQINDKVPYLRIKQECKWAGVILGNVIVEQGICYTEKDIQKLVKLFMKESTEHD